MLRAIFVLNLVTVGLFYLPGWLALRVLTLGRYPPPRGEPHSEEAVALFGFFVALALLLWWLL
ncbi:hypothetical protein [Methyloversatilis discipulorum]|uniref:hypothetical protein n=1 Tax=Methyloversatilis discipulorum TaxID=1119528 RepID=UPI001A583098|nr:hypothetical protein [Methyloversatilis discipulorum]MBL8466602.1 hypothetical protein [Methyloversatilis discipulorum]